MAAKAKAHILPWVDNILSRMIFYFRYSSWVRRPPPPPALGSGHVRPWSSLFPVPSCALAPRRRPRQDETLKQSFLAAILMLVGAISRNEGAHSYEFSQLPELFECLMVRAGPGAEAEAGGRPPPKTRGVHKRPPQGTGAVGRLEQARAPRWLSHPEAHARPHFQGTSHRGVFRLHALARPTSHRDCGPQTIPGMEETHA